MKVGKKNSKWLVFTIVFYCVFYNYSVEAQIQKVEGMDTIDLFNNYKLIIKLPFQMKKTETIYEEGFFVVFSNSDTNIITIHSGRMVKYPLAELDLIILDSFVFENELTMLSGYSLSNKKYFRELDFPKKGLVLMYEGVDDSKKTLFDSVLNNVKIIRKE